MVDFDSPLRWAIAGRSAEKLDRVAQDLGTDVEHIVADASDADALAAMTARTKVVVSTVARYRRPDRLGLGDPLPDLAAARLDDGTLAGLRDIADDRPLLLVFGSFT